MEQVLGRYRLRELENLLQKGPGSGPVPPVGDRSAWQAAATGLGPDLVARLVDIATAAGAEPVPPLPATLWLEFERTGVRTGYEEPYKRRRALLGDLAVAECLRAEGTFLGPVLDLAWAICEESSWAFPAHYGVLTAVPSPRFDLGVAETALLPAELDSVLGERLPPELCGDYATLRITYEPAEVTVDVVDVPDIVLPERPVDVIQVRFAPVNRARDVTVRLVMSVVLAH